MAYAHLKKDQPRKGNATMRPAVVKEQPGFSKEKHIEAQAPYKKPGNTFNYNFGKMQMHSPLPVIQAKLSINKSGDKYEKEADAMADQISKGEKRNEPPGRFPNGITPIVQTKGNVAATTASPLLENNIAASRGTGSSMDDNTRSLMAGHFGIDFSKVKIHTDDKARYMNEEINARAFTTGNDIYFNNGEYTPGTANGKHLLAHELTHVAQQATSKPAFIQRQVTEEYQTAPVTVKPADVTKNMGESYWEQLLQHKFSVVYMNATPARFKANTEERDAVMSVLWQVCPKEAFTAETEQTVSIPARTAKTGSQALLYKFTFKPKPTPPKGKEVKPEKDKIEIDFISEGAAATIVSAAPPPAAYTPSRLKKDAGGFPGSPDDYFAKYPEEQKQLYHWIEKVAGASFDQIVTTKSPAPASGKQPPHESSIKVKGIKKNGKVEDLNLDLLSESAIANVNPATGYDKKDFADLQLEKAQQIKEPAKRLGKIEGLDKVPVNEQYAVKYYLNSYFTTGSRNAEVDVIVPIPKTALKVLYTFRFYGVNNDVKVERIGEEGKDPKLDLKRLDIGRITEYANNSKDVPTLQAWIKKRYPGAAVTGTDVADLTKNMNTELNAKAGTSAWFKTNYNIEILDAAAAETHLQKTHKLDVHQVADMKVFTTDELVTMELALQTLSDPLLGIMKGTQMMRQKVMITKTGTAKKRIFTPDPDTGGLTLTAGTDKSIIIFDSKNDGLLFTGNKSGARSQNIMLNVHEFGHVIEAQSNTKKAFNDFVATNKIKPVTWYVKKKPAGEFFPEAFAIFQSDPEWMKLNLPLLHGWFETLARTGQPP